MEIASNNILSITPPSFQLGAEEAKRESNARVQIPQPKDSQGSQGQSHINDQRGNTQGQNSQLSALSQGLQQEKTEALRRDQRQGRQNKDDDNKKDGDKENKEPTSTKQNKKAELAERNMQVQKEALLNHANSVSHKVLISASDHQAASFGAAANNRDLKGFLKPKVEAKIFTGAKFSNHEDIFANDHKIAGNAIKRRYNSIMPSENIGNNLNIQI